MQARTIAKLITRGEDLTSFSFVQVSNKLLTIAPDAGCRHPPHPRSHARKLQSSGSGVAFDEPD
jgi:hypothetical protein